MSDQSNTQKAINDQWHSLELKRTSCDAESLERCFYDSLMDLVEELAKDSDLEYCVACKEWKEKSLILEDTCIDCCDDGDFETDEEKYGEESIYVGMRI